MFDLFTYIKDSSRRISDFEHCLAKNVANVSLNSITIFTQAKSELQVVFHELLKNNRVFLHECLHWPKFSNFFSFINEKYQDKKVIVANGDIYFDETLELLDKVSLDNKFLHITRKELHGNPPRTNFFELGIGAGDTWVFNSPITITNNLANVHIGNLACDHFVSQAALRSGYQLFNPCLSINCWHKHPHRDKKKEDKAYQDFMAFEKVSGDEDLGRKYGIQCPFFVKFCDIYAVDKQIKLI